MCLPPIQGGPALNLRYLVRYLTPRRTGSSRRMREVEYTELDMYPLSGGRLTTWTPEVADTAWQADPRGLSWDHTHHLSGGETGTWIGSAMRLTTAHDPGLVRRALRAWLLRHEGLRTTVTVTDDGWTRRTAPPDAVDVVPTDHGELTAAEVHTTLAATFARVSPARWPHVRMATVEGPEGTQIAFGADHSVMDAYSQLLWFAEISELVDRLGAGESTGALVDPTIASHVDHSAADRALGEGARADHPTVQRWARFLDVGPGAPRFPSYPDPAVAVGPVTDGSEPQHSLSAWVADPEACDRLHQRCRAVGTSLQSGALGVLLQTLRETRGVDEARFVLPLHTRHDPAHLAAVGWYVGCVPVAVDLAGARGFDDVLRRVDAEVRAVRGCVDVPLPRVAELLGLADHPHFVVSFVDTRHVPGAADWGSWEARALRSPAHADDEVYVWLVRSRAGLSLSARFPRTPEADAGMRTLVEGFRQRFGALASGAHDEEASA